MSSPAKGGSQPCGWQIALSRDSFCDFGRKLGNLPLTNLQSLFAGELIVQQTRVYIPFTHLFRTKRIHIHDISANVSKFSSISARIWYNVRMQ